jgi:hypothetical protein
MQLCWFFLFNRIYMVLEQEDFMFVFDSNPCWLLCLLCKKIVCKWIFMFWVTHFLCLLYVGRLCWIDFLCYVLSDAYLAVMVIFYFKEFTINICKVPLMFKWRKNKIEIFFYS